jgi:hypothetical protein
MVRMGLTMMMGWICSMRVFVFVCVDCRWWSSGGRLVGVSPTVPFWSALAFSPDTTLEQVRDLGGVLDCGGMVSEHVVSIVWVVLPVIRLARGLSSLLGWSVDAASEVGLYSLA